MANTKTLNTRIQLKYDTLENWTAADKNPILLSGEIAITSVPVDSSKSVGQETKPAILFKVGDGTNHFNDLPWTSALAADVYAWAKKASLEYSDLPEELRTEIDALQTLTGGELKLGEITYNSLKEYIDAKTSGIATDAALSELQAKVRALEAALNNYATTESVNGQISTINNSIAALSNRITAIENDYLKAADKTALESAINGKVDKETGKSLISDTEIERLATLKNYNDTEVKASIKANADDIKAIKDGTNIDSFKDVEDTLTNTYATKDEAKGYADAKDAAISAAKQAGDDAQADVDTLIGADTGKSVRTIANEELAAQLIPENAQESLDTLQEIAAWIQSHPGDATAMNEAIEALKAKTTLGTNSEGSEYATVKAYVEAAIAALNIGDYATAADLTALAGRVSTAEGKITTLEGQAHTHDNKALLDTYTQTEEDLADAVSKKHDHTNKSVIDGITAEKVNSWDAAEQNAKDYVNEQFASTLILNCGSASTVLDKPTTV